MNLNLEYLGAKCNTSHPYERAVMQELTAEDELGQNSQKTVELDQQSVGRLSRMDAMQSQAMAKAQRCCWGRDTNSHSL